MRALATAALLLIAAAAPLRIATTALLLIAMTACNRRTPIDSCTDNLHGVWLTPAGARWMMLDNSATLEAYPLFDDSVPSGAPRVIDLSRGEQLAGEIKRRFMQRAETCDARAPIRITACKADQLQVVLGDVTAPMTFSPCTWGQSLPSRVETWRRE